ncbi:FAD-dependent oxidoreductase [compost metagenome]
MSAELDALAAATQGAPHPLRVLRTGADDLQDAHGQLRQRYGSDAGTVYLLRPDGYVLGRWTTPESSALRAALAPYYPSVTLNATQKGQA